MIPEADQIQAVANAVSGYGLILGLDTNWCRELRPRVLDSPWDELAVAVLRAEPGEERAALEAAVMGLEGGEALLERILAAAPVPRFPSLEEIAKDLPPIEWLWEGWIPLGMISLVGAVPGAGKSLMVLDLARRIIAGEEFPDGSEVPCPGTPVVYVDAEAVPQLTNERADRWGMDKRRLFLMTPTSARMFIDFGEAEDREHLAAMAARLQPGLVIVDSLSTISSKGENDVQDVRDIMAFLTLIARQQRCGLVLVHHLKKGNGRERDGMVGIEDLRGSGHIVAIARSVLGLSIVQVGPKFDRNGPRRLEVIKTNLAGYPAPLGVEFVAQGGGVVLRYGEPPVLYKAPTMADECGEWLLRMLEERGEPVRPREIVDLGKAAGFGRTLIYDVREQLEGEITNTRGRKDSNNMWALPEMVEADADDSG